MNRRSFIKNTSLAAASILAAPYILPSGRLFAQTGSRSVNHVVFCLFAGGVRNLESVQKAEGNLMRNLLQGTEAISSDISGGMSTLPLQSTTPLQKFGTLFKEFRYKEGPTGHFNGHTTALTGRYTNQNLDLRTHPAYPTVFEYYLKHASPERSPLNAWWVADSLGPYGALNYSNHPSYGALYGANYIQPSSFLSYDSYQAIGNPKNFSTEAIQKTNRMRSFLDKSFGQTYLAPSIGIRNNEEDLAAVKSFIDTQFQQGISGALDDPWGLGAGRMNNDMFTIFMAEQLLKTFHPELLVVNIQGIDIGHTNYTSYCDNIRKADYAVAHLWNTIQNTPGLQDDTVLIIAPEHGRNLEANTLVDAYGRYALDHTGDQSSRELFCLILGPPSVVKQNQQITTVTGESIDIVPTIARLLGFDSDIPSGFLSGRVLEEAFV